MGGDEAGDTPHAELKIDVHGSLEEVLAECRRTRARGLGTVWKRRLLGVLAGLMGVAGLGALVSACIGVIGPGHSPGIAVIAAGIGLMIASAWLGLRLADLSRFQLDRRPFELIEQVLGKVSSELDPDEELHVFVDFTAPHTWGAIENEQAHRAGQWFKYDAEWLLLGFVFADRGGAVIVKMETKGKRKEVRKPKYLDVVDEFVEVLHVSVLHRKKQVFAERNPGGVSAEAPEGLTHYRSRVDPRGIEFYFRTQPMKRRRSSQGWSFQGEEHRIDTPAILEAIDSCYATVAALPGIEIRPRSPAG